MGARALEGLARKSRVGQPARMVVSCLFYLLVCDRSVIVKSDSQWQLTESFMIQYLGPEEDGGPL